MRLPRLFLRGLALSVLAALLVGVPLLVFRLIGNPLPSAHHLQDAWASRRVDADLVIDIGGAVFAVLWAWFAITAITELWQVLAWRLSGARTRLAPLPPGPSGWVRSLVRFIAMSTVSISATIGSVVPLSSATASAPAPAPALSSTTFTPAHGVAPPAVSDAPAHRANGRDTPYSLATTAGQPGLRERIIELNLGRVGPDGAVWQGGVFPAGMDVVMPHELVVLTPLGPAHQVVAGDSYWQIADDHLTAVLQRDATPPEVLEYTEALVDFNHPLLGHRDPALIVPGELVVLTPSDASRVDGEPTTASAETTGTTPGQPGAAETVTPSPPPPPVDVAVDVAPPVEVEVEQPTGQLPAPSEVVTVPLDPATDASLPGAPTAAAPSPLPVAADATSDAPSGSSVLLPYTAGVGSARCCLQERWARCNCAVVANCAPPPSGLA